MNHQKNQTNIKQHHPTRKRTIATKRRVSKPTFLLLLYTLVVLPAFISHSVWAAPKIYKCVDRYGKIKFTDRKKRSCRSVIPGKSREVHVYNLSRSGGGGSRKHYTSKRYRLNRKKFSPIINKAARDNRLSPALIHAVIHAESSYNPNAVSHAGAVGLMQLMPATARRYGVSNRRDPSSNISGGARYLRDLLNMFNGNIKLAVAAYNAGEGAVKKYGNQIPPYRETRGYVRKVLAKYNTETSRRN